MALYAFLTDRCLREARDHGQISLIENLKEQIHCIQRLVGFSPFLSTHFLKRALGRGFRLIAYQCSFDNDELIVLLRVLPRGGNDYEYFLENWAENTVEVERRFGVPSEERIKEIYAELTDKEPLQPLPVPDQEELDWLYPVFCEEEDGRKQDKGELLVLETGEWVKKMRSEEMREFLGLYHQLLEGINLDEKAKDKLPASISNQNYHTRWDNNGRFGFAYIYRPDLHRLLLLEPLRRVDEHRAVDLNGLLSDHLARLAQTEDDTSHLARVAVRSYPYLMVLDQDAWLTIQKDEDANLALSPEEADLLDSIRYTDPQQNSGYPLFINGRAGSGKSTMLQYLAADYLEFALRRGTKLLPLYMTCSRDLLERGKETVRSLLTVHHERLLEGKLDSVAIGEMLDRSFVVFHEYLYSLLPAEARQQFPPQRFVNYAEFRRLWQAEFAKRSEARQIGVDLAWHTIRSYIKGIRSSLEDELVPEEFDSLPKKRRSVTSETYRLIYERVWESWYKRLCEEKGYWDDQDLAVAVLESGAIKDAAYAAIFCDEAQDFTPIELELILQLSVFSRRSLQPEQLKRVPFAFAGDPLQTLNPTGFKWETVQADFHDRFCAVLDPRRRAQVKLNPQDLNFNYRSNPGIVKFCNLIQLLRAALIGGQEVKPQNAWWIESSIQPVWLDVEDGDTVEQMRTRTELVKVVNCDEGEETNYVRQDSILPAFEQEQEGVYRNILSPIRAKGLEFPSVALYRFGEHPPAGFEKLLSGDLDVRDDPEARLPHEYFLNRLYVAASRAKGELIVVDSRNTVDKIWRFATDSDTTDALMARAGGKEIWRDKITFLVKDQGGKPEGRTDPREQAQEYENQGNRKRDSYLLRQAALAYRSASNEIKAGQCLALALKFDGKLKEAGRKYQEIKLYQDAFDCYWKGKHFEELCGLTAQDVSFAVRPESRAADFVVRATGVPDAFLSVILEAAADTEWIDGAAANATWRYVFGKLVERLSKVSEAVVSRWYEVHRLLERLTALGVVLPESQRALIAYRAGDYAVAIQLWDVSGDTERDEYRRAKARLEHFPRNLIWFGKLKDHTQVLSEWRQHFQTLGGAKLEREVAQAVADAAIAKGEGRLAIEMLALYPERGRLESLLTSAVKEKDAEIAIAAATHLVKLWVHDKAWNTAIKAVEELDFVGLKVDGRALPSLIEKAGGVDKLLETLVFELAISEDLPAETTEKQASVSEFLHRQFVRKARPLAIPIEVVGAAIERTGRIVYALQYYEPLYRDYSLPQEKRGFAAQRYVRVQEKYAEYFRSQNNLRQAEEREAHARRIRDEFSLGSKGLPDFPSIRKIVSAPDTTTEWDRGPYKITLSRTHNRLRIEHTERFETVTVFGRERHLKGDALFSQVAPPAGEIAVWKIDEWGTTIRLFAMNEAITVKAEFNGEPLEVELGSTTEPRIS